MYTKVITYLFETGVKFLNVTVKPLHFASKK